MTGFRRYRPPIQSVCLLGGHITLCSVGIVCSVSLSIYLNHTPDIPMDSERQHTRHLSQSILQIRLGIVLGKSGDTV